MTNIYKKLILPTRPQPDTIVGIFLLKFLGREKYPGIEKAEVGILQNLPNGETSETLEQKGILALDIGGGKFDHHQTGKTISQLIAADLGILNDPAVSKMLSYAERDDKYGKGTISTDLIDKAFGLSGLVSSLNKTFVENPEKVINAVLPLLFAHYSEERKRNKDIPEEYESKLKNNKAELFEIKQNGKKLKVVALESGNVSMAGWLRSSLGPRADVVCQKTSTGYVNILTRPLKRVDLRLLAAYLRIEEAKVRGINLNSEAEDLLKMARVPQIPQWYYDQATNSILNGGTNPTGIEPTALSLEKIKELIKKTLGQEVLRRGQMR